MGHEFMVRLLLCEVLAGHMSKHSWNAFMTVITEELGDLVDLCFARRYCRAMSASGDSEPKQVSMRSRGNAQRLDPERCRFDLCEREVVHEVTDDLALKGAEVLPDEYRVPNVQRRFEGEGGLASFR